jgi:hypothetical protein
LVIAAINIFWFHYQVQKSQAEWDALPSPPLKVKLSGAVSLVSWLLIIVFGRFIAYDWYRCEKVEPGSFVYVVAECKQALSYLDEGATEEPAPAEEPAPDTPPPEEGASPSEAAPTQPVPGQGG